MAVVARTLVDISPTEPIGTITRTLNAPREVVWRAVSEPRHLVQWWGPHGYTNAVTVYDFRVGGRWQIHTVIPNGPTVVSPIARRARIARRVGSASAAKVAERGSACILHRLVI